MDTSLLESAEYGAYLGLHQVEGVACHHVGFANSWMEWQVWVDAENDPVPRKLVINYTDEPGEPQYSAVFHSWNLEAELPEALFEFEAPVGAEPMEARSFLAATPRESDR